MSDAAVIVRLGAVSRWLLVGSISRNSPPVANPNTILRLTITLTRGGGLILDNAEIRMERIIFEGDPV